MVISADELTNVNTAINKSMILMDNKTNSVPRTKSRKSITINTTIQAASTPLSSGKISRKSILKKTDQSRVEEESFYDERYQSTIISSNNCQADQSLSQSRTQQQSLKRPHNLQELIENEEMTFNKTPATFSLEEVNEDDELWLMDIPKTIDPLKLKGQVMNFGGKSKFKIEGDKYLAMTEENDDCSTCVLATGNSVKPYKTVNLRPSGKLTVRRKLPNPPKPNPSDVDDGSYVPSFPTDLKVRDPLMGVTSCSKIIKKKSKSKIRQHENSD